MTRKPQPWIHSWYGDFLGLHGIPLIFAFLAFMRWFPFQKKDIPTIILLISAILVLDWAHIFAQWLRIYSNPLETKKLKILYPLAYFLLIPVITVLLRITGRLPIETFLIYFVIYHFIKQNFGYIRIYASIDGPKSKAYSFTESAFIYLSMWTPVLYWHLSFPWPNYTWPKFFFKIPFLENWFPAVLVLYGAAFCTYLYFEVKKSIKNQQINLPKNLAILAAALGWGLVSILSTTRLLVYFTVVLSHDVSYMFFVWFIARRDTKLMNGKVGWLSWGSVLGFVVYFAGIIVLSQTVLVVHHNLTGVDMPNLVYGNLFSWLLQRDQNWWYDLGVAVFFSTQAHHYFIDKYLWKKEKDLGYMTKAGKYSLPSVNS